MRTIITKKTISSIANAKKNINTAAEKLAKSAMNNSRKSTTFHLQQLPIIQVFITNIKKLQEIEKEVGQNSIKEAGGFTRYYASKLEAVSQGHITPTLARHYREALEALSSNEISDLSDTNLQKFCLNGRLYGYTPVKGGTHRLKMLPLLNHNVSKTSAQPLPVFNAAVKNATVEGCAVAQDASGKASVLLHNEQQAKKQAKPRLAKKIKPQTLEELQASLVTSRQALVSGLKSDNDKIRNFAAKQLHEIQKILQQEGKKTPKTA